MTGWSAVLLPALVAVAVLTVPGLLVLLAFGLRGLTGFALAAPLSVTIVALSAVAAELLGVPFGLLPVVLATAAALMTVAIARLGGRSRPRPEQGHSRRDTRRGAVAGLTGAVIGGACAAAAMARGIGRPDAFPQTFDAMFHLNAVWQSLQSGDASSLMLGTVAAPDRAAAFYPAAWHDIVFLVARLSGTGVVVSVTAVSLAIAAVVWPAACIGLTHQLVGERPGMLFGAGVLSAAFGASPYLLLSYGTVWPNALATALLPAVLACIVAMLRGGGLAGTIGALDPSRAALLVVVLLPGVALSHPNVVLSALLYGTVLWLCWLVRWASCPGRGRVRYRPPMAVGAAAIVLGAQLWLVVRSPLFAITRSTQWRARETLAQASGEWLLAAPLRSPVPWTAALLVLVGCAIAARGPGLRRLVLAHGAAGGAFVLVAGSDGPVARALSGPWYDDPFRLAALLGVTAVPLAAIGLQAVADAVWNRTGVPRWFAGQPAAVVASMGIVLALATGGMYAGANGKVVGTWYTSQTLAGPAERQLLEHLPDVVPAGVPVAGNPWNGSVLSGPLGSRPALYPHLQGRWGADRDLLAGRLNLAASDGAVCGAVRRLGVRYVIVGPSAFWTGDRRQARYAGLDVAVAPGFQVIAHGGRLTLYRITTCGLAPRVGPS